MIGSSGGTDTSGDYQEGYDAGYSKGHDDGQTDKKKEIMKIIKVKIVHLMVKMTNGILDGMMVIILDIKTVIHGN